MNRVNTVFLNQMVPWKYALPEAPVLRCSRIIYTVQYILQWFASGLHRQPLGREERIVVVVVVGDCWSKASKHVCSDSYFRVQIIPGGSLEYYRYAKFFEEQHVTYRLCQQDRCSTPPPCCDQIKHQGRTQANSLAAKMNFSHGYSSTVSFRNAERRSRRPTSVPVFALQAAFQRLWAPRDEKPKAITSKDRVKLGPLSVCPLGLGTWAW